MDVTYLSICYVGILIFSNDCPVNRLFKITEQLLTLAACSTERQGHSPVASLPAHSHGLGVHFIHLLYTLSHMVSKNVK